MKITQQARAMVTIYGLNKKIGNITYYQAGEGDYGFTKPYSEETAKLIDEEISGIVETQYIRAIDLLKKNKSKLTELAEHLLEKEVIFKDDLERIFGVRPFGEVLEKATKPKPKTKKITAAKVTPPKEDPSKDKN